MVRCHFVNMTRESLPKGKDHFNWPPYTNQFRSAAFMKKMFFFFINKEVNCLTILSTMLLSSSNSYTWNTLFGVIPFQKVPWKKCSHKRVHKNVTFKQLLNIPKFYLVLKFHKYSGSWQIRRHKYLVLSSIQNINSTKRQVDKTVSWQNNCKLTKQL